MCVAHAMEIWCAHCEGFAGLLIDRFLLVEIGTAELGKIDKKP